MKVSVKRITEPDIIVKNGKKVRKKTDKQYKRIWKKFLEKYEKDFKEYMGYGKEEIEKIGIEEFIDTFDWFHESDIETFKEGKVLVTVCQDCKEHYGYFPMNFGLCDKCFEQYDLSKLGKEFKNSFENMLDSLGTKENNGEVMINFVMNPEFRKQFKK